MDRRQVVVLRFRGLSAGILPCFTLSLEHGELEHDIEPLGPVKDCEFNDQLSDYWLHETGCVRACVFVCFNETLL